MPDAQLRESGALIDAEEHLAGIHRIRQGVEPVVLRLAPGQPAQGALAGGFGILIGRRVFHALVEGHGDIRAQVGLNLHGLLRPHKDAAPVDVGGEGDPFLLDLAQARQGEHLEPARVGQDRAVPPHEPVQAAHLPHHLVAGAQVKVVGVGQLYLTADLLQIVGRHRTLDGPLGAHVHEHRRLHRAVGAGKDTPAGLSLCFQDFKHVKTPLSKTYLS